MRNSVSRIRRPYKLPDSLRKLLALTLVALLSCWTVANRSQADAGDLDQTFGTGGRVNTDFMNSFDFAFAIAVQPDGKIIAAGESASDFALARYNSDGSLDASFGAGGKVTTDFSDTPTLIRDLALQPDSKIIAVGDVNNQTSTSFDFALARYNSDGSLDTTFGKGGKVTTDFGNNSADIGIAVALQSDGKIVVTGLVSRSGAPTTQHFGLARYSSDGSLDLSFANGGKTTTEFFGSQDAPFDIGVQPDGKILIAGVAFIPVGDPFPEGQNFALLRYNTDGNLDPGFGSGGKTSTEFDGSDEAMALSIQEGGRFFAAGRTGRDFALAHYNADGSLDTSFSSDGKMTADFFGPAGEINTIAFQPDGKILVAGIPDFRINSDDFALARYNADGTLDSDFGTNGEVITDFFNRNDGPFDIATQPDGKILLAGRSSFNFGSDFALARYEGDAIFDICLQDDSNGDTLMVNSITGLYQFTRCSDGVVVSGTGNLISHNGSISLKHVADDRRVLAKIDRTGNSATASLEFFPLMITAAIKDRNTSNNSCACP